MDYSISLPSKPRVISEEGKGGIYEIDGLFPGYGHTLGNSLRRIILASLPGTAITSVKIDGVDHEFATMEGVKEDVVMLLLNLKKVRFLMHTDEPQTVTLKVTGPKVVTAADIETPGQVEVMNTDQHIAEISGKHSLDIEMVVERGLGYVPREVHQEDKVDIGTIALDAAFTPIRRVHYEVENMRVGDRTDFNRLRIFIETDGTLTAREALERSIEIMIHQLKAVIGFKEEVEEETEGESDEAETTSADTTPVTDGAPDTGEVLKTRIDTLNLSQRTINVLNEANIRTVGGLVRKKEEDILGIPGMGVKGLQEIKRAVSNFGITLKS